MLGNAPVTKQVTRQEAPYGIRVQWCLVLEQDYRPVSLGAPREGLFIGFRGYFEWFLHSQVTGSVLLLACTVTALILANSPWQDFYNHLLHTKIGFSWNGSVFKLSLHHWINDGLMVLFFFVVGLEIKRELVVGRLSSFDKAILPVAAAAGGMVVPAAMYAILNAGG
jgi:NhaA family Na+:H+ antiporter